MEDRHETKLMGWHPTNVEHDTWIRAEARNRGVPLRELLDQALAAFYRTQTGGTAETSAPARPVTEARPAVWSARRQEAERYLAEHPEDARSIEELLRGH